MVTNTAQPDSSSKHHSQTVSGDTNNPNFPRKNLPSPWAQVVRGGDSESLSGIHQSPPSSSSASSSVSDHPPPSDSAPKAASASASASPPPINSNTAAVDNSDGNSSNAGRSNRPVWNMLSNGDVDVSPVMGAVSWPALSKSNVLSAKSSAESSSKGSTDGSLPISQAPVTSHTPHKQAASNAKPNFATNHSTYNRQRPMMKRGGGSNIGAGPAQNSFPNPPQPPPPPPFPLYQIPPSSYNTVVPVVPDPSSRELLYKNSWDPRPSVGGFMPVVNDQRSSSRRGSFVPRPRADGSYHNNYGGRRDQDRGNYANSRDPHVNQPRMPPRGFSRHLPPNTATFVAPPQPLAPFPNPVGFPEYCYFPTLPLEPFRGMPFFTHGPPPAMFFPVAESPLTDEIVRQIDYYFSDANLVRDDFLKRNMDEQGWVRIRLIAGFPRVKKLTSEIQEILESLRTSNVVEVQGDKVRRRNDWMAWLPPPQVRVDTALTSPGGSNHSNVDTALTSPGGSNHSNVDTALTSPGGSNHSNFVADFEKISLELTTDKVNSSPISDVYQARSTAKASSPAQLPNGDAIDNASPQLPNGDAIDNAS